MGDKKKIALYYPWVYLKGGAERLILNIVSKSRHNWTIFTNHFDRDSTFPEFKEMNVVELSDISVKRGYSTVGKVALKVIFQKVDLKDFDLLVIVSEGIGDFFVFRNHDIPIFCICLTPLKIIHDPLTKARYLENNKSKYLSYFISSLIFKFIDRFAWKYYKKIFSLSNEVKNRVLNARLAPEKKVQVLHPGIDFNVFRPMEDSDGFFLIPGRIMWQKNIELGIESFKMFQKENENSNYKLLISGMLDEKSVTYYEKLRKMCNGYNNIEFIINPSDRELIKLYKKCYCVLFTSINEDWGFVNLEAMAFGKPIISVNKGGPKESIIDGKTGFLIEPTINEFVNKMKLLVNDTELTKRMGMNGREHVQQFDLSEYIKILDDMLEL